jgi:signal peptidase I
VTRLRQALLTGGAILGAICLLAALGAVVLDVRPMVFRSGSMSPTIPTGALALVHRVGADDISRGDVVGVIAADGSRVTHRVVDVTVAQDVATLRMRGDANTVADPEPYRVTEADRVLGAVPRLGYAVGWLTTGPGRFVLGVYGAVLLLVLLRPTAPPRAQADRAGPAPGRRRAARPRARARARIIAVVALVALGGSLELTHASHGWAAWTDSAAVIGTTLPAHAVVPPISVSCSGGGLLASLTYSWPSKDVRYTYRAELVDSVGTVRRTDLVPESGQGGYSVTYAVGDLPPGSFTVRVSSFLSGSTTWASSTTTSGAGSKAALFLGLTTACDY